MTEAISVPNSSFPLMFFLEIFNILFSILFSYSPYPTKTAEQKKISKLCFWKLMLLSAVGQPQIPSEHLQNTLEQLLTLLLNTGNLLISLFLSSHFRNCCIIKLHMDGIKPTEGYSPLTFKAVPASNCIFPILMPCCMNGRNADSNSSHEKNPFSLTAFLRKARFPQCPMPQETLDKAPAWKDPDFPFIGVITND